MILDYLTFGYDRFKITDKRIFNYPNVPSATDSSRFLILKPHSNSNSSNRNASFITVEVCWDEWIPASGDLIGVPPGGSIDYGHYETRCNTYTMYVQTFYPVDSGGTPTGGDQNTYGSGPSGGTLTWGTTPYFWSNDPCQGDPTEPQAPSDNSCRDGVIGWQPMYPFLNVTVEANDFTNPCIVAAKNKIGDLDLNYFGKMLLWQKESGTTQKWKISFEENRNLVDQNGNPAPSQSFPITPLKIWHIQLNPIVWEQGTAPNSTQEMAGLMIIHEFIHGFIWVYRDFFNLDFNNLLFSSHKEMFENCVGGMTMMLEQFFNLSHTDATALALQGMDDIMGQVFTGNTLTSYNSEKNQFAINNYGISLLDAHAIFEQYLNGTKGTRCF